MNNHSEIKEKLPVSICIIAYNEEAKIMNCLDSVKEFDDIVIVLDSRTIDNTARLATAAGCRVYIEDWKGDGPQKQSVIDKSKYDWILMMDADERLPEGSLKIIKTIFSEGAKADAYNLKRRSYIGNRMIKHSGWWPDRVTRLFNKRRCRMKGITHSSLNVDGKTINLDAFFEHFTYTNYAHMIEKMNKYSTWLASELKASGKKANLTTPATHGAWMFFRTFILKRGFLDGLDGLTISVIAATGSYLKYAKLLELQRENRQ